MELKREFLWSGSMPLTMPLSERVAAAGRYSFSEVTVFVSDYLMLRQEGPKSILEMQQRAADLGVGLSVMDGIAEWYPHVPKKYAFEGTEYSVDDVLGAAEDFGSSVVQSVALYPATVPVEGMAEHFAELCDRAALIGAQVLLEFLPVPPVGSVQEASKIVEMAGRANGKIVFDTWHFFRGDPNYDELARVPGERILGVQVNDGAAHVIESPTKDAFRHRLQPGDGTFDLARVLGVLDSIGALRAAGPEIFNAELHRLSADEIARQISERFDRLAAELSGT